MLKIHSKSRDSLSQYCPFPVGAVYLTFGNSDPSTIWAGTTWTQIAAGTFLVASGTNYNLRTTGGAASVTLTSAQSGVPAHAHGLNSHVHSVGAHAHGLNSHKHSVGAHAHGLNDHTHTYNQVKSPTGSTAITVAQMPKNYAKFTVRKGWNSANTWYVGAFTDTGWNSTVANSTRTDINPWDIYTSTGASNGTTITLTGGGDGHTHTIGTESKSTGKASGSTANSTAFDSGAASGSTANSTAFDSGAASGNTANNTAANASAAHENRPPYIAVAMWERTA